MNYERVFLVLIFLLFHERITAQRSSFSSDVKQRGQFLRRRLHMQNQNRFPPNQQNFNGLTERRFIHATDDGNNANRILIRKGQRGPAVEQRRRFEAQVAQPRRQRVRMDRTDLVQQRPRFVPSRRRTSSFRNAEQEFDSRELQHSSGFTNSQVQHPTTEQMPQTLLTTVNPEEQSTDEAFTETDQPSSVSPSFVQPVASATDFDEEIGSIDDQRQNQISENLVAGEPGHQGSQSFDETEPNTVVENTGSGPPAFIPPNDDIVHQLNNAVDFLAVARSLQLRRRFMGRSRQHSTS